MSAALLWTAGLAWLVAATLGLGASRRVLLWCAAAVSASGGACCLVGGVLLALSGRAGPAVVAAGNVAGQLSLRATPLAAPFLVLLGVVALAIGCFAPRHHRAGSGTGVYLCAYNLALVASFAVLTAGGVVTFLVAWESMTLASAIVVLRHQRQAATVRGAFVFLALSEVGFVMVVAAFVILATQAHTMDLHLIAVRASSTAVSWRSAAFVLALLGFGFKAGLVPLHIWLPAAYPVAPADGSAFLSALVNLGVYGMAVFAFELLGPAPVWWGLFTLALGALSAVIGILYAVMERDLKRFLAYSSVENVGIIVTALGAAMTFTTYGQRALGAFLLLVALYHVVNHGTYKTLLFLEAGVIEHSTGTRDLDRLGGLVHRLRRTAVISLVGTLGIAALPPLNGFVTEWLVFQGLFQGFRIHSHL
ncbi:MAG: hypothetical protein J2P59_07895, partial [Acidimicrobiales bacterium]|nr:hypothetical protein [Acidimicrobiales bacterium]